MSQWTRKIKMKELVCTAFGVVGSFITTLIKRKIEYREERLSLNRGSLFIMRKKN